MDTLHVVGALGVACASVVGLVTQTGTSDPAAVVTPTRKVLQTVAQPSKVALTDSFASMPRAPLHDGAVFDTLWTVVWSGGGAVSAAPEDDASVRLRPAVAGVRGVTHSALVVSRGKFRSPMRVTSTMVTSQQLRTGSPPNPWESGWLLFHYTDPDHFYYLVLKPNGWELGKRDPAYPGGQRFLATGDSAVFPTGSSHRADVRSTHPGAMEVSVDGVWLVSHVDAERPYAGGRIGLYCEDADVLFDDVAVTVG